MARVRDLRGGREYDPTWGRRMSGEGAYAGLLKRRFDTACRRLGLNEGGRGELDTSRFLRAGASQAPLF